LGTNETKSTGIEVRGANPGDLEAIVEIDRQVSGTKKTPYWRSTLQRYSGHTDPEYFLVAERDRQIIGFIVGKIRAWEFGSPPCGWVYAIGVAPSNRLEGTGSILMDALCEEFQQAGVSKVRTMISRKNLEVLSFFRSYNMMAGPFLQLELDLETAENGGRIAKRKGR